MPRLKTFQAHLGFFDTVVAAPSQKAALQAWGSRQNLFQNGTAGIATDQDAIKAALAKPGVVLKRLSGSSEAFVEQPTLPKVRVKRRHKPANKTQPSPVKQKPQPDRSRLDIAKRALDALKQERDRMQTEFAGRERALRQEKAERERDFHRREADLRRDVEREQKSLRS
jgi:colicin import membrane protein